MAVALVTGAARGIGRATAMRLARDGFDVAVNSRAHLAEAEAVAGAVRALGRRALAIRADVSQYAEVAAMVERVRPELGAIDVLVNNAGIYERASFEALEPADWGRTIATNLHGTFHCTKLALPDMRRRGWGRVVSVSTVLAFSGTAHGAHYAASKAAIVGFTKALAREVARDGVTVNAVAPGAVDTAIIARDTPETRRRREGLIPIGRVGRPEEIASLIGFLCSRDADWITGQTFHANGGVLMW